MKKGLMIMKTSIILLASGLILVLSGCCKCQSKLSVLHHAKDYRETTSYDSLKWIETNFLKAGISSKTITKILGKTEGVSGEAPENTETWLYPSIKKTPQGHLLLIHFENQKVVNWEWASQ